MTVQCFFWNTPDDVQPLVEKYADVQQTFDWDESKHPRDADGKFASKSTPTESTKKAAPQRPRRGSDQLSRESVANQRALNAVFANAFVDISQIEDPTIRDLLPDKVERRTHPTSRSKKMPLLYFITARKHAKQAVVKATSKHLQKHGADEFLALVERETLWADETQPGYYDPWARRFLQGGEATDILSDSEVWNWKHPAVLESPYKDVLFWASHKNVHDKTSFSKWEQLGESKKVSKFKKPTNAERIENVTQKLVDTWANTSGDSDVLSLALQQAAIEEFDLPERVSETESVLLDTDQENLKQRVRELGGGPAALIMPREFAKEIARYPDLFGQTSQVDVKFDLDDDELTGRENFEYRQLLRLGMVEHPATRQRDNFDIVAVRFDDAIDAYTAKQAMYMLTRSQHYGTKFDVDAEATITEHDLHERGSSTSRRDQERGGWPIDLTSDQADAVFDERISDGERAREILKYCDPDKDIAQKNSRYRDQLLYKHADDLPPGQSARKQAVQTLKTMNRAALNTAAKLLAKRHQKLLGQFLRVQHDRTQKALRALPGDSVTLYRGLTYPVEMAPTGWDVTPGMVSNVDLSTNALSSWSTDQDVAESFADPAGFEQDHASFVLEMTVPKSSILATPLTGIGCLSEQECVVVGRSHNAHAYSQSFNQFRNFFAPDATEEHQDARDTAPLPSLVKSVLEASGSPIHPTLAAETDPHVAENYALSKWDESKHPRDADGKFAPKSTPTKTKNKPETSRPASGTNKLSFQSVANQRILNAVFANAFVDETELSKYAAAKADLKDSRTISMPYVLQATARRNAKKSVVDTIADELLQAGAIDDFVERAKRQWALALELEQGEKQDLSTVAPFYDVLATRRLKDIEIDDKHQARIAQNARRYVQDVTQKLVDTWANTSGDSDVLSLALQQAAIEEFDLPERVSETESVLLDTDQSNLKQKLQRFHDGPAAILMPKGFAEEIARHPDLFGETSHVELPRSSQSDELERDYRIAVEAWTWKPHNEAALRHFLDDVGLAKDALGFEYPGVQFQPAQPASDNVVAMRFENAFDAHNAQLAMQCLINQRTHVPVGNSSFERERRRWPRPLTPAQADAMFDAHATPQQRAKQIVEHFSPESGQHDGPYSEFFVEQSPDHDAEHWKTNAMDDLELLRERHFDPDGGDEDSVHPDDLSAYKFANGPDYDQLMKLIYSGQVSSAVEMLKRNKLFESGHRHIDKIGEDLHDWVEAGQSAIEENVSRVAINTAAKLLAKRHEKLLGQFLRVQHDRTQKALRALPGDSVTLYRGLAFDENTLPDDWRKRMYDGWGAAGIDIATNALSSWTTLDDIAVDFSSGKVFELVKMNQYPFVMEMTVPKSSILATPLTGIGCLSEQECVVVGRSHRANVVEADVFSSAREATNGDGDIDTTLVDDFFISPQATTEHELAYATPPSMKVVQQVLTDAGSSIHKHLAENTE